MAHHAPSTYSAAWRFGSQCRSFSPLTVSRSACQRPDLRSSSRCAGVSPRAVSASLLTSEPVGFQLTPFSPPSGPTQWLFQGPPAQSKFLAANWFRFLSMPGFAGCKRCRSATSLSRFDPRSSGGFGGFNHGGKIPVSRPKTGAFSPCSCPTLSTKLASISLRNEPFQSPSPMTTRHLFTAALAILGTIATALAADPVVSNLARVSPD